MQTAEEFRRAWYELMGLGPEEIAMLFREIETKSLDEEKENYEAAYELWGPGGSQLGCKRDAKTSPEHGEARAGKHEPSLTQLGRTGK